MNKIIPAAEQALFNLWGGSVRLTVLHIFEKHRHALRPHVQDAPTGSSDVLDCSPLVRKCQRKNQSLLSSS